MGKLSFTIVMLFSYLRTCILSHLTSGGTRLHYQDRARHFRRRLLSRSACVWGAKGNDVSLPKGCRNVSIAIAGRHNRICIGEWPSGEGSLTLTIAGSGNLVQIGKLAVGGHADISLSGDDGILTIKSLWVHHDLTILNGAEIKGTKARNARCSIGKGCTAESLAIYNHHTDGIVSVGDNVMIAPDVVVMNSDTHPIYDRGTGTLVNRPQRPLVIGDHSWIGTRAVLLKGTQLPHDTIVGFNATVSGVFLEANVALAGCPAKVVRRNVDWKTYDPAFV